MKPLELRPPTVPLPHEGPELLQKAEWRPYPKPDAAVTFFPLAINEERYRLYTIAADLLPLVLSGTPEDSPLPGHAVLDRVAKLDGLGDIEQRLLKWYRHLRPEAQVDVKKASRVSGPQVDLQ